MDNAVYIALSKQLAQFRAMDIIAQNIANADTTSYKRNGIMFTQWQVDEGHREKIAMAQDLGMYRNTQNGPMKFTGNPMDVAIQGDGYFVVEGMNRQLYTRAGNFQLDANGVLINQDGYPVLDAAGQRITIPLEARSVDFTENGAINIDGEPYAQLDVVSFANEQKLERLSGTLYATQEAPVPATGFRLAQQFQEGSNVQSVVEMTNMIDISRKVGNTSQFMDTAYDLQRRALQTWARQQ